MARVAEVIDSDAVDDSRISEDGGGVGEVIEQPNSCAQHAAARSMWS